MADKPKRDFINEPFDPETLTPEEVPEAMGAMVNILNQACEHAFPTQGNPKRAEFVAAALLTVACRFAGEAGIHPVDWLKKHVALNVAYAKAEKANQN